MNHTLLRNALLVLAAAMVVRVLAVFHYSLVVVPLLCVLQAYLFVWLARHLRGSMSGTPNGVTAAVKRMSG